MVREKTNAGIGGRCLIAVLTLFTLSAQSAPFKLGTITQASGKITYLEFAPPHHKLSKVKEQSSFMTDGSYLTSDDAFLTVNFFDGSWLRLSPRSKIASEFDPNSKVITLHLFTGSAKLLISTSQNDQMVSKLVVKSVNGHFESSEGKFTVVRNPLNEESTVYVEKGIVLASKAGQETSEGKLIHAKETASIKDRANDLETPRKMTEKEMKFLHPSHYLKK